LRFLPLLPWVNLHYTHTSNFPGTKSHVHFLSLKSFIQGIRPSPRLLVVFVISLFLMVRSCWYNRTTAIFNYENDLMFNLSVYFNQFW
jgi:hypothetical protein